jgi:hypothetical protein
MYKGEGLGGKGVEVTELMAGKGGGGSIKPLRWTGVKTQVQLLQWQPHLEQTESSSHVDRSE